MRLLDVVTIGCVGLLIGTELTVSAFINPIVWKLDGSAQISAIRMFAKRLGAVMPFWYVACLVLLIVETIVRRAQVSMALLVAASCIWVAVIGFTLLFLVPINNGLARMSPNSVAETARFQHRKWDRMHRYRVAALGTAMLCLLIAISS